MSTLRIALNEWRRLTAGRLPKIAIAALTLIPVLYGGLYLYANHDPYSSLKRVPAALVVQDTGATKADGSQLRAGDQVAKDLLDSGYFKWTRTDAGEATSGVRGGRYDFALTLPVDFSKALASTGNYTPQQSSLVLTTNDANNYLARTIATQVTDKVHDSLAKQVGTEAADAFMGGLVTIRGKLSDATDGATQVNDGATKAKDGATELTKGLDQLKTGQQSLLDGSNQLLTGIASARDGAGQLRTGANSLSTGLNTLRDSTTSMPQQTAALATGAKQVADGSRAAADSATKMASGTTELVNGLDQFAGQLQAVLTANNVPQPQIDALMAGTSTMKSKVTDANAQVKDAAAQLNQLATGSAQVSAGASQLAASAPQLTAGINQAATGANQLRTGADDLYKGLTKLHDGAVNLRNGESTASSGTQTAATGAHTLSTGLETLSTGTASLTDGLRSGTDQVPNLDGSKRKNTANTIGDPVRVENVSLAKAGNYGEGLAPFFVSLAAWIGGYVLFLLIRPISNRAMAANHRPVRIAVAGWLPPAWLGAIQMAELFVVLLLCLRMHPAHPVATLAFMVLTSVVFVAIVHTLNAWFGTIGEFIGLVLMVLQLVSAGGTFPWQTLPGPLRFLHVFLPMSFSVDGLRHLLYGGSGSAVLTDSLVLTAYLVGALALTTMAARRLRVWSPRRIKPEIVL